MEPYKLTTVEDCNGATRGMMCPDPKGAWAKYDEAQKELDALHAVIDTLVNSIDSLKREKTIRMFELRNIAGDLGIDCEASVEQIRERAVELTLQRDTARMAVEVLAPPKRVQEDYLCTSCDRAGLGENSCYLPPVPVHERCSGYRKKA